MSIEKAISSHLRTKASIIALVNDRVYPEVAPDSADYPFITYTIINEDHEHSTEGAVGMANVDLQLDVWAEKFADRVTVTDALRNALDGFTGNMGADNLNIRSCFLSNRSTFTDRNIEGKGQPVHRSSMDFSIWHVESVPTL